MMSENPIIFELQAKLCQTLAQPVRLRIINLLKDGPQCVTSIAEFLKIPQPTISRHLTVLRSTGMVTRERRGQEVFYAITSPKIVEVCEMMRAILMEQESHHLEIFNILKE